MKFRGGEFSTGTMGNFQTELTRVSLCVRGGGERGVTSCKTLGFGEGYTSLCGNSGLTLHLYCQRGGG
jgi:hypothetical protein